MAKTFAFVNVLNDLRRTARAFKQRIRWPGVGRFQEGLTMFPVHQEQIAICAPKAHKSIQLSTEGAFLFLREA